MTQPYGQPPPPPQYGQPQYGGPQGGYGQPGRGLVFGVVGAIIAVVGAALCVISFTAVDWFTHSTNDGPSHFSDVKKAIDGSGALGTGVAKLYFGWLAWVLLGVGLVVALLADAPTSSTGPLRPIGLIIGLAGAGVTFWALKFLTVSNPGYSEYLKHSRLGFYFAVAGFLLIGVGALVGPRRRS